MSKQSLIRMIGNGLNVLGNIAPTITGKIGFRLFCTPFGPKLQPYHFKFLNTASKFELVVDGKKLQCYKWGNGDKKLLFVHGWASFTFRWKRYIEYFGKKNYTVYAFDAMAHGLSEGKTLNLLTNAACIKKIVEYIGGIDTAVCHSFGGFSIAYLLKHFLNVAIGKTVIMGSPGEAKQFFDFSRDNVGLSEKTNQLIIERFKINFKNTPAYFSTPAFAKDIKIPCLIIHDKDDIEAPIETAYQLHKNWEGSKMIVTEGLGHHLKSDNLIYEVEKFIEH